MPMSPRLKMRRGRFGPGGFAAPTLLISVGSPFGWFVAVATDDLDGNVSANVQWFIAGPGSPGRSTFGSPWFWGSPYPHVYTGSPAGGSPLQLPQGVITGAHVNLSALIDFGSPIPGSGSPTVGSPFIRGAGDIGGGNQVVVATVIDSGGKRNVTTLVLTDDMWP